MVRGIASQLGDTRTSKNGYHYTRVKVGGWRFTHHLMMEQKLGRALRKGERVVFKDGDKTNLEIENLELQVVGKSAARAELARLESRREDLNERISELKALIDL